MMLNKPASMFPQRCNCTLPSVGGAMCPEKKKSKMNCNYNSASASMWADC